MDFFEIVENNDETKKMVILIKRTDISFINAIRRIMMLHTREYAFDDIEIKNNDTVFNDEFIKHRINLIPLTMNSQMTFTCDIENPTNNYKYVLSNDLIPVDSNIPYTIMDNIPIVVLNSGEHIQFSAKTNNNCGNKNIMYSPIITCYFSNLKKIKTKDVNENVKNFMYNDYFYGHKYLLKSIDYQETDDYAMTFQTILKNPVDIFIETLHKCHFMMDEMKQKHFEIDIEHEKFYGFSIDNIDYSQASIFVYILNSMPSIVLATYTNNNNSKKFFFKIEFKHEKTSIQKLLNHTMDYAKKTFDVMLKDFKTLI